MSRRRFSGPGGLAVAILLGLLLAGLPSPLRAASADASVASTGSPTGPLPAILSLPWSERAGFNATLASTAAQALPLQGPVDIEVTLQPSGATFYAPRPNGALALTTAQVAATYGATGSEVTRLSAYFRSSGLEVGALSSDRLSMHVSGDARAMGQAFGTRLLSEERNGAPVTFPASPPDLPAPLESWVTSVTGLTSGNDPFTLPLMRTAAHGAQSPPSTISPNDARKIYDIDGLINLSGSSHWAAAQGIAVVLWGSGYNPQDLANFWAQDYPSQFPVPNVVAYPVDGAPGPNASSVNDPSNSTQELSLDIEWSASQAPGATIDAVYAPDGPASGDYSPTDSSMEDAINEAITSIPGVSVVSMSFASSDGADPPFEATLSQLFQEAGQKGITIVAASGDDGGTTRGQGSGCTGGRDPQFPAASPYVLAVGGTAPVLSTNALGGVTGLSGEPAWDDSGGGYALDYAAPSWQLVGSAAAPISGNGSHRGIPDVAGPAAQNMFYFNGGPAFGSGTSFAAPMWAGLVAEMDAVRGHPLGFIDDRLYALETEAKGASSSGLVDITEGASCVAAATPGWDAATGWGSPRAAALFEHLAGTFAEVALSASATTVAPGGSVTLTLQVTNASSRMAITNLPVSIAMTGSFPGPCTGSLTTVNTTTNSSGGASSPITVPSCYLGSAVSISATVDARGYIGGNSTQVNVNLFGLAGLVAISETFPYNVIFFAVLVGTATVLGLWLGGRRTRRRAAGRRPAPYATRPVAPPASPIPSPPARPPAPAYRSPAAPLPVAASAPSAPPAADPGVPSPPGPGG